ncbi:MAG: 50S ribosomal protein L35 [Candidatus Pacebacteria bacterium]|nr:50S ribosomal protein L35 [Candidatus Paceibacterota bacterium]
MKTNKSYSKRLKVTKTGKTIGRKPGQNHFNAKATGEQRRKKRNGVVVKLAAKVRNRFLPHA